MFEYSMNRKGREIDEVNRKDTNPDIFLMWARSNNKKYNDQSQQYQRLCKLSLLVPSVNRSVY